MEEVFASVDLGGTNVRAAVVDRDGKIVAAEVKMLADGGAYKFTTSIVVSNSVLNALGPYEIPNVKVDAYDVYTNNVPRGAFRGFGGPQGAYVAEQQVNKLAAALGMDPVELRLRNLTEVSAVYGVPYTSTGLERCLREGAQAFGWAEARARGVIFDVGHGAGSFWFRNAVPAVKQGFIPDSISTDLHTGNFTVLSMTQVMWRCSTKKREMLRLLWSML